jgi:hypothetical protein
MPCRPANGRSKAVHTPDHIMISERGTLKHNLPMLALTNRMVFGDLWFSLFGEIPTLLATSRELQLPTSLQVCKVSSSSHWS